MFSRAVGRLQQWSGPLALFLVLTGGVAYAVDTVGSADVIDNSLLSADLKNNKAVKSVDVVDDTAAGGGLGGSDVAADALGGNDINESSLGKVPTAADADFATQANHADTANGALTAGDANNLDGLDSTDFLRSNASAGGDLAGSYPNPTLRAAEGEHYVGATGEPAFANGWGNFGSFFHKASFYKDRAGVVHLSGLVDGGTYGPPNTVGRIFTIPSGYAPCGDSSSAFGTSDLVFATISSNAIGRISVFDTGGAGTEAHIGAEVGSGWISLDGISWRADGC